jgi:hypothetical protein
VAFVSLLDLIGLVGAGGWREGGWTGDKGPAVYGPAGIRAAAMWRKSAASGQAAAKASPWPMLVLERTSLPAIFQAPRHDELPRSPD